MASSPQSPVPSPQSDTALATGVGSLRGSIDSAVAATVRRNRPAARARPKVLPPLADSIADKLVFPPVTQGWFLAAARGKRLLVDIGRVDMEVRRNPARLAAYKLAVAARTPFPTGTRFRLRGPWGADDATINGFDTWNGRIVATVATAPRVDSLARTVEPLPVTAQLVDSASEALTDTACVRGPLPPPLDARVKAVRDSLEEVLRLGEKPPYERLLKSLKYRSTAVPGCFPGGRAIVVATAWAGEYEWVREIVDPHRRRGEAQSASSPRLPVPGPRSGLRARRRRRRDRRPGDQGIRAEPWRNERASDHGRTNAKGPATARANGDRLRVGEPLAEGRRRVSGGGPTRLRDWQNTRGPAHSAGPLFIAVGSY